MNTFNLWTFKVSLCLKFYIFRYSWNITYTNWLHGCTKWIFKIIISYTDFPIVCCILISFVSWSRPPNICGGTWTCTCYLVALIIVIKYSCWPESIIVSINSYLTPTRILNHNICWVYPRIKWTFKYNCKSYSIRGCYICN